MIQAREQQFRSATEPFQHLEDREVVLWGLTFVQVVYGAIGVILAFGFAMYVSPFSGPQTMFVAILIAGLPPTLSWIATQGDVAPWTMTRALIAWLRSSRRFAPGGSQTTDGYLVEQPVAVEPTLRSPHETARVLEEAWEH
jgi:hypothetical protein